ncbi:hypothetical protein SCHPADRAFT_824463 [Schizopora paradoxa]|uniref:Uncharacterized protein n=1 Tax=Schizopora paradoxa TaxID=27342 RepID=A0A0H2SEZ3_9AGAM|nr:hypothetical protein SCHPADRAFT_824463 [Schizopora paradoxa]
MASAERTAELVREQQQSQEREQRIQDINSQIQTIVLEPRTDAGLRTPSIISQGEFDDQDQPYASSSQSHSSGATSSTGPPSARIRMPVGQPTWTHRVSASFSAMADQIAAASQAIALIPPMPDAVYGQLSARMEEIEATQQHLESELAGLREQLAAMNEGPEKFQKQLDDHIAAFKLEQQRLPARLHNSMVTVSKMAIKALIMANGKPPPQFPATRGEFEHLTKERYEALLKSYDIPLTGLKDTAAKRDALKSFVGLPQ